MTPDITLVQWRDLLVQALEDMQAHYSGGWMCNRCFPLADYFIVASAYSHRHLWALCQAVEDT